MGNRYPKFTRVVTIDLGDMKQLIYSLCTDIVLEGDGSLLLVKYHKGIQFL